MGVNLYILTMGMHIQSLLIIVAAYTFAFIESVGGQRITPFAACRADVSDRQGAVLIISAGKFNPLLGK